MADFMRAPVIYSCNLTLYNGLEGYIIEVVALDNFKVISAFCTIYPSNKILFTVFDFAGNETRKVLGD